MESPKGVTADLFVRESGKGLYLYCFFNGPPSIPLKPGIDGVTPTFTLSHRNLCALVSRVPLDEYNEETLNERVKDLKWLAPRVQRHEEIVRSVMGCCPVLPVRFGTLYTSDERVLRILRNGYETFCSFLEFVQDKEEWGVKVYADEERIRNVAAGEGELIRELDRRLSSATPGEAYLLRRKRDELVQREVLRLLDHRTDKIYQQVLCWSVEGRRNKLLSKRATGKEQNMILNAALLILKPEVASFKERIDGLAATHEEDGLSFEISGPWPPYNFCPDLEAFKEGGRG